MARSSFILWNSVSLLPFNGFCFEIFRRSGYCCWLSSVIFSKFFAPFFAYIGPLFMFEGPFRCFPFEVAQIYVTRQYVMSLSTTYFFFRIFYMGATLYKIPKNSFLPSFLFWLENFFSPVVKVVLCTDLQKKRSLVKFSYVPISLPFLVERGGESSL